MVLLGGAEAKRSIKPTSNYFVLMCACEVSAYGAMHGQGDLAIDDIQLNRRMAEQAVCRSRYCMLAGFRVGDPVYVDRPQGRTPLPFWCACGGLMK